MPKYSYNCSECGENFEIHHSMLESIDRCIMCEAPSIRRNPSSFFSVLNKKGTGRLVDEFIRDSKAEIKIEKQRLKGEYDD